MTEKMDENAKAVEKVDLSGDMQKFFSETYKQHGGMLLAVDATFEGVRGIPKRHESTVNLKLRFEKTKRGEPEFTPDGVKQELGFQGNWFEVFVPYGAIWFIWNEQGPMLIGRHLTPGALAAIAQAMLACDVFLDRAAQKENRASKSHLKAIQ